MPKEFKFKVGDRVRYKYEKTRNRIDGHKDCKVITEFNFGNVYFDDGGYISIESALNKPQYELELWNPEKVLSMKQIATFKTNTRDVILYNKDGVAFIECGCFKGYLKEASEYQKKEKSNRLDYEDALVQAELVAVYNELELTPKSPSFKKGQLWKNQSGDYFIICAYISNSDKYLITYLTGTRTYFKGDIDTSKLNIELVSEDAKGYLSELIKEEQSDA